MIYYLYFRTFEELKIPTLIEELHTYTEITLSDNALCAFKFKSYIQFFNIRWYLSDFIVEV